MTSDYMSMRSTSNGTTLHIEGGSAGGITHANIIEALSLGFTGFATVESSNSNQPDHHILAYQWAIKQLKNVEHVYEKFPLMPAFPSDTDLTGDDGESAWSSDSLTKALNAQTVLEINKLFDYLYSRTEDLVTLLTPSLEVIKGPKGSVGAYVMVVNLFKVWWKETQFVTQAQTQDKIKSLEYLVTVFDRVEGSIHYNIDTLKAELTASQERKKKAKEERKAARDAKKGKKPKEKKSSYNSGCQLMSARTSYDVSDSDSDDSDDSDSSSDSDDDTYYNRYNSPPKPVVGHSLETLVNVYAPAKALQAVLAENIDLPTLVTFLTNFQKSEKKKSTGTECTFKNHVIRGGWLIFLAIVLMDKNPVALYNSLRLSDNPEVIEMDYTVDSLDEEEDIEMDDSACLPDKPKNIEMDQALLSVIRQGIPDYIDDMSSVQSKAGLKKTYNSFERLSQNAGRKLTGGNSWDY